jgi:hypothetical protein
VRLPIPPPRLTSLTVSGGNLLEAPRGFEPRHKGFADLSLTTWVRRHIHEEGKKSAFANHFLPSCLKQNPATWWDVGGGATLKRGSVLFRQSARLLRVFICPNCLGQSGKRDSNPRHQPWQGCALPTELFPHCQHKYNTLPLFLQQLSSFERTVNRLQWQKKYTPHHIQSQDTM